MSFYMSFDIVIEVERTKNNIVFVIQKFLVKQ